MGVWIETEWLSDHIHEAESHPAWVCGLKRSGWRTGYWLQSVTPCVGVWIETSSTMLCTQGIGVTPCVGVWIETVGEIDLKPNINVTPCVGVWIETQSQCL